MRRVFTGIVGSIGIGSSFAIGSAVTGISEPTIGVMIAVGGPIAISTTTSMWMRYISLSRDDQDLSWVDTEIERFGDERSELEISDYHLSSSSDPLSYDEKVDVSINFETSEDMREISMRGGMVSVSQVGDSWEIILRQLKDVSPGDVQQILSRVVDESLVTLTPEQEEKIQRLEEEIARLEAMQESVDGVSEGPMAEAQQEEIDQKRQQIREIRSQ